MKLYTDYLNHYLIFWTVQIPWDIEEYYWEHVKFGRDEKRKKYPNPSFGKFSEPLTVVDRKGRIILWYLPGLISLEQQVSFSFRTEFGLSHQSIIDHYQTSDRQRRVPVKKIG